MLVQDVVAVAGPTWPDNETRSYAVLTRSAPLPRSLRAGAVDGEFGLLVSSQSQEAVAPTL